VPCSDRIRFRAQLGACLWDAPAHVDLREIT